MWSYYHALQTGSLNLRMGETWQMQELNLEENIPSLPLIKDDGTCYCCNYKHSLCDWMIKGKRGRKKKVTSQRVGRRCVFLPQPAGPKNLPLLVYRQVPVQLWFPWTIIEKCRASKETLKSNTSAAVILAQYIASSMQSYIFRKLKNYHYVLNLTFDTIIWHKKAPRNPDSKGSTDWSGTLKACDLMERHEWID